MDRSRIGELLRGFKAPMSTKRWDIFISHAYEDKETVALPLAGLLRNAGLEVWIDAHELALGDSLREKIDEGLAKSRFGVVIVSQAFLSKVWPKRELAGLLALEDAGEKIILPVWHGIKKEELASFSPILADRFAEDTEHGLSAVAKTITSVVLHPKSGSPSSARPKVARRFIKLLESNPAIETLRDFLSSHSWILQAATFGLASTGIQRGEEVGFHNADFIATYFHTSAHAYRLRALLLARPDSMLFMPDGSLTPALDEAITRSQRFYQEWEQRYPPSQGPYGDWNSGTSLEGRTVIISRRSRLSFQDRYLLRDSKTLGSTSVRTYDWLVDVAITKKLNRQLGVYV